MPLFYTPAGPASSDRVGSGPTFEEEGDPLSSSRRTSGVRGTAMLFFLWVICISFCISFAVMVPAAASESFDGELLKTEHFRGPGAMGAPAYPRIGGLPCPAIRIVVSPSPSS